MEIGIEAGSAAVHLPFVFFRSEPYRISRPPSGKDAMTRGRLLEPNYWKRRIAMKTLLSREPYLPELFDLRREFDQVFNRMMLGQPIFSEFWAPETPRFGFVPPVEAYVDKAKNTYVCRVSLPAIEPKEIEINAKGNLLTIHGERKVTHKTENYDLIHEEFRYGVFERTLTLPEGVQTEKLVAEYKDGVLEVTAPIAVAALPKKVEIKAIGPATKQATA
jgi:HSP20 family protein